MWKGGVILGASGVGEKSDIGREWVGRAVRMTLGGSGVGGRSDSGMCSNNYNTECPL